MKNENKEKLTVFFLSILVIFAVCAVGWGVISLSISSISLSNDQATVQNATSAMSSSGTVYNIIGVVVMIGAILAIVGLLYYFASTQRRFNRLGKILEFLIDTAYYFVYGLLAIVIVVVPSYMIYLLYNYAVLDGHAGDVVPILQWIGLGIVAFFGIAALGYVFKKKIVDKYQKYINKEEPKKVSA